MPRLRWLSLCVSLALAGSAAGLPPNPAKGKEVFQQCTVCHNATTDERKIGPSLKGLFNKIKLPSGKKIGDQTVLNQINQGGNGMPPFKDMLSDEEKSNVLAYLKTL